MADKQSIIARAILKRKLLHSPSGFGRQSLIKTFKDENTEAVIKYEKRYLPGSVVEIASDGNEWASTEALTDPLEEIPCSGDIIEFESKENVEKADKCNQCQISDMDKDGFVQEIRKQSKPSSRSKNHSFHRHMAFFVCRDRQPLNVICGEGFQHLINVLCPIYKPPSPLELQTVISKEFKKQTTKLRKRLSSLPTLSISCSVATTKNQKSWLEMVVHFQEQGNRINRNLPAQALPQAFTAKNVKQCLERMCKKFDILKSNITCIVTMSSPLLEDAVISFLSAKRHLPCFGHFMISVLEAVMQRPVVCEWCQRVSRYVERQKLPQIPMKKQQPVTDSMDRPLSLYQMLKGYLKNKLLKSNSWEPPLSSEEEELAHEVVDWLRPLISSIKELCRASFSSASQVLPITLTLINELRQEKTQEHQIIQDLRIFTVQRLQEHFEFLERNKQLAMATLLDPRFRKMPFQNSALVAKYMKQLYDLIPRNKKTGELVPLDSSEHYDIWSAYNKFSLGENSTSQQNPSDKQSVIPIYEDEVSSYFSSPISSVRADPLQLWQELAPAHPSLYAVAQKYLHIPATTMPSIQVLTSEGFSQVEQNSKLLENAMDKVIFLSNVPTDEWKL